MQKRMEYRPVRQVPHRHSGVYCVGMGPWEYCYEKHRGSQPLAKRCRPARMVNARWNEKADSNHAVRCSWSIHLGSYSVLICIVPSIPRPRSDEAPSREIVTIVVAANLETIFVGSGRVKNCIWQKEISGGYAA
jgi:hypothetical protein